MMRVLQLVWDGVGTRKAMFAVLCLEILAASFVMSHSLGLVQDIALARKRMQHLQPFEEWYQLTDTASPEVFSRRAAAPDFEGRLASLANRIRQTPGVELVVLPKSQALVDTGASAVTVHLATPNIRDCFGIELQDGVWLDEADCTERVPVVAGSSLKGRYRIGQPLGERCYVCGILAPGSRVYDLGLGIAPISLDDMLIASPDPRLASGATLDAVLNSPIVRFRSAAARETIRAAARDLDLYDYRFWRLDQLLDSYVRDLHRQLAFESAIVATVLGYALSAFVFTVLRAVASRRKEFGVHLAYGASHLDFWVAVALEMAIAAAIGSALPLAVFRPPWAWAAAGGFAVAAVVLACIPAWALRRRTIPELLRGAL